MKKKFNIIGIAGFAILLFTGCVTTKEQVVSNKFKPSLSFKYSDKITINYEKKGRGNQPLLLIHGFGSSLRNWDDVIAKLANNKLLDKKFTLYAIDLKGYGFSSKPKDNKYTIKDQAEIVKAFIENYSLKHPVIVGHSMGGVSHYTQQF